MSKSHTLTPYFRDHVFVGRSLIFFKELESTNLFLLKNKELLDIYGLVVTAQRQTAGIGRKGRRWEGGSGPHLFCSYCLRQEPFIASISSIAILVGLSVYECLKGLGVEDIVLKWPNDILIGRRKVSGVLCQSTLSPRGERIVVAGIGINVKGRSQQFSEGLEKKAITLEEAGISIEVNELLKELTKSLENVLLETKKSGLSSMMKRWQDCSNAIGMKIVFEKNGIKRQGKIIGLDEIGRLRVLEPESARVYLVESGQIEFSYG